MKVEEPIQVVITGSDSQKGANREIAQAISKIHELKQAANPEKDVVVTLFSKDKGPKKIYNVGKKSLAIKPSYIAEIERIFVFRKWVEKGFAKDG